MRARTAVKASGRPPVSGQAGFSLIESVVSIALTSIVIVALAAGLLASIRSSTAADRVQRADAALASFSESLRAMPAPPEGADGCPHLSGPDGFTDGYADFVTSGEGWSLPGVSTAITKIEHWEPSTGEFATSCPAGGNPHVHRLSLSVAVDGDSAVGQVVVSS